MTEDKSTEPDYGAIALRASRHAIEKITAKKVKKPKPERQGGFFKTRKGLFLFSLVPLVIGGILGWYYNQLFGKQDTHLIKYNDSNYVAIEYRFNTRFYKQNAKGQLEEITPNQETRKALEDKLKTN